MQVVTGRSRRDARRALLRFTFTASPLFLAAPFISPPSLRHITRPRIRRADGRQGGGALPSRPASSSSSSSPDPFPLRTAVPIDPLPPSSRIQHPDPLLFVGSCFSDNIGQKLQALKYTVDVNPFGIVYNPVSIHRCLDRLATGAPFQKHELCQHPQDGRYFSFDHHTAFSDADPEQALRKINTRLEQGHTRLLQSRHLFLTLGTAHVFVHAETEKIVGNCHKLPASFFTRRLLSVDEIVNVLSLTLEAVRRCNPKIHVTFTVSPVRHIRNAQGPVQNTRSKAHLLTAVHEVMEKVNNKGGECFVSYFPAYEIMMDDLRDYRFYETDMLHPTPLAVDYIHAKLIDAYFDQSPTTLQFLRDLSALQKALVHRPLNPSSAAHQSFLHKQLDKVDELAARFPHLDLAKERETLEKGLLSAGL